MWSQRWHPCRLWGQQLSRGHQPNGGAPSLAEPETCTTHHGQQGGMHTERGEGEKEEGLSVPPGPAARAQDEVQGALALDVVVGEGAGVLQLLAGVDEALLVGRDALAVLWIFALPLWTECEASACSAMVLPVSRMLAGRWRGRGGEGTGLWRPGLWCCRGGHACVLGLSGGERGFADAGADSADLGGAATRAAGGGRGRSSTAVAHSARPPPPLLPGAPSSRLIHGTAQQTRVRSTTAQAKTNGRGKGRKGTRRSSHPSFFFALCVRACVCVCVCVCACVFVCVCGVCVFARGRTLMP